MKKYYVIAILVLTIISCNKKLVLQNHMDTKRLLSKNDSVEYQYYYNEGVKFKVLGEYQKSLAYLNKAIKIDPQSSAPYFAISEIYNLYNNRELALYNAKLATQNDPDNIWYKQQAGNLYLMNGKLDSAILVYDDLVKENPERFDLYNNLAILYNDRGDFKLALELYDRLEEKIGISETIIMAKQQLYSAMNKPDKAIEEVDKLLKLYPGETKYLGVLAELYAQNNMDDKALLIYQQILDKEPENSIALLSLSEYYRNRKEYDQAFHWVRKAIHESDMTEATSVQLIASYLSSKEEFDIYKDTIFSFIGDLQNRFDDSYKIKTLLSDYYVNIKEFDKAIVTLKEIVEENQSNIFVWEQLLFLFNFSQDADGLYAYGKKAVQYFPDEPSLNFYYGFGCFQKKLYNEAISAMEEGLKHAENNQELKVQFFTFLGESYKSIGNDSKSDENFDMVLLIDPENVFVLNNYSYYLSLREEKLDYALKMSEKLIALEENSAAYLDTYAWVLYKHGQIEKAKFYIEKALENGGMTDPDILEHYGDILYKTGNREEANVYWKMALKLGDNDSVLQDKIEKGIK